MEDSLYNPFIDEKNYKEFLKLMKESGKAEQIN
jgi:hypothetical protein